MTSLYTCRSAGEQYRLTKLTPNLDVESSYLCSAEECQCPGFERRQRCRHLDMLPRFIHRGHIGDNYAHDFDRNGWVQIGEPEPSTEPHSPAATTMGFDPIDTGSNPVEAANSFARRF